MEKKQTALRKARRVKKITLKELATRARLSYSQVRRIDAGDMAGGTKARFLISTAMKDGSFKLWPSESRPVLRSMLSIFKSE